LLARAEPPAPPKTETKTIDALTDVAREHTIEAKLGERGHARTVVDGEAGATTEARLAMSTQRPDENAALKSPLVWAGAGVAVLALGFGIGTAAASADKGMNASKLLGELQTVNGPQPCRTSLTGCSDVEQFRRDQGTLANVALWSFVGAGLAAAGTAVYAIHLSPRSTSGATLSPTVAINGGGIVLRGMW